MTRMHLSFTSQPAAHKPLSRHAKPVAKRGLMIALPTVNAISSSAFFSRLKQFRRIATRYEKLARNFLSMLNLAAAYIWLA